MKQSITFLCVVCAALSSACINGAPKEILDVLIVGGILAEPLKVTVEADAYLSSHRWLAIPNTPVA